MFEQIEALHIGNWFSSYVYDSPVLSEIDDFQDSGDGRKRKKADSLHCGENVASQGDIKLPTKVVELQVLSLKPYL